MALHKRLGVEYTGARELPADAVLPLRLTGTAVSFVLGPRQYSHPCCASSQQLEQIIV